jgi:hypothetical protein
MACRTSVIVAALGGLIGFGKHSPQGGFVRGAHPALGNQGSDVTRGGHVEAEIPGRGSLRRQPHASDGASVVAPGNLSHFGAVALFDWNFRHL